MFIRIAYLVPKLEKKALLVPPIGNHGSGERKQKYRYHWKAKIITGMIQYNVSSVAMRRSIVRLRYAGLGKFCFLFEHTLDLC
jgi:hypothetical protein